MGGFPPNLRSHYVDHMQIFGIFCYPRHYVLLRIIKSLRASVYQYVPFSEAYFREGVRENPLSRGRITPKGEHTLSAWPLRLSIITE